MLPVHLRDDYVAEIDGDEAAVADVEKVCAEGGIAAPDDKNVILRLAVPDSNQRVNAKLCTCDIIDLITVNRGT